MQRKSEIYLKNVSEDDDNIVLDVYFKVRKMDSDYVNIIEVSDAGIIIYDTRICKKVIEDKFNYMKMIEITEEDFNVKLIEKLKQKELE